MRTSFLICAVALLATAPLPAQTIPLVGRMPIDTSFFVRGERHPRHPGFRTETRVFSGYYTPGFESSKFVPCANDTWVLTSDSLSKHFWEPSAWVTWSKKVKGTFTWPRDVRPDEYGNPTFFVRWYGSMTGPGRYGHMGVSDFLFKVDSVLAIEMPRKESCS
jgi:hypothetical protein